MGEAHLAPPPHADHAKQLSIESDDNYPSYRGTPSYGCTPKPTPLCPTSSAPTPTSDCSGANAPLSQRPTSFVLRSALNLIANGATPHIGGGGGDDDSGKTLVMSNYVDGHELCNVYVDDDQFRCSGTSRSPAHIPCRASTGRMCRAQQNDIYTDVEAGNANMQYEEGPVGLGEVANNIGKPSPISNKRKPPLPINLKFKDVKYKVTCQQATNWGGKPTVEKQILHGITGSVACGEFLAMMGPSGSGKTTFLSLLGGKKYDTDNARGSIQYNQLPFTKNLKKRMGFVTQDDVLFPHLTVRETLRFAAMLRLGRDMTKDVKLGRAEEVLGQLGLQKCADTMIGNQFLQGVSGGERKRVCIGQEILVNPSILFLDEPTSGLDSTIALRLIKLLQQFAHEGRTVVTTIHQPSSRVFHMFDKVLLLSEGHGVYFGMASGAMSYFESIGFSPLLVMNPADFLLDLCSGNVTDISLPHTLKEPLIKTLMHDPFTNDNKKVPPTPSTYLAKDIHKYLVVHYENQMASIEKLSKANGVREPGGASGEVAVMSNKGDSTWEMRMWETSWWEQFVILWIRGIKERRHEYLSTLRIIQVVVSAFLAGCLWWRSKTATSQHFQDQMGLIFFIAVFWSYLPLFSAIFAFPLEKAMLAKERSSNMYRLSAFFMARILGDLPLDMALPCVFMVILYFMTNLERTLHAFVTTLLTIFLTVLTSQGFGLLIGAAMMDVQKATTFASVAILVFMLAGGFFVQYIPPFISWIKYLSFQAYTFNILMWIQYSHDISRDCASGSSCDGALQSISLLDATKSAMALLVMVFSYRLLAYIALRCMRTSS